MTKSRYTYQSLAVLITSIGLVACGGGSDGGSSSETSADSPPTNQTDPPSTDQLSRLQDSWTSTCIPVDALSMRSVITFEQSFYHQSNLLHLSPSCDNLADIFLFEQGSVIIGTQIDNDTFQIDFNTVRAVITPISSDGTLSLNLTAFCGITDWVAGTARDVTSAIASGACFGTTLTFHTTYRLDVDTLTIALPTLAADGTSPEKRAADFNSSIAYLRQSIPPLDECGLPPGETGLKLCSFVSTPTTAESITLKNYGNTPIDLTNWTLWDEAAFTRGDGEKSLSGLTISANGFLTIENLPFQINDSGETIRLISPQGVIIDQRSN